MPAMPTALKNNWYSLEHHYKGVFSPLKSFGVHEQRWGASSTFHPCCTLFIPGSSAYATMKGSLEVLTRHLAKELRSRGSAASLGAREQ